MTTLVLIVACRWQRREYLKVKNLYSHERIPSPFEDSTECKGVEVVEINDSREPPPAAGEPPPVAKPPQFERKAGKAATGSAPTAKSNKNDPDFYEKRKVKGALVPKFYVSGAVKLCYFPSSLLSLFAWSP